MRPREAYAHNVTIHPNNMARRVQAAAAVLVALLAALAVGADAVSQVLYAGGFL